MINGPEFVVTGCSVLVVTVEVRCMIVRADTNALRSDLLDIITQGESLTGDMMSTLWHGVVVASTGGTIVATSDGTFTIKPLPSLTDLATIAAHGIALVHVATGGCVGYGKKCRVGPSTNSVDAHTVVKGLSGAMSPAGAAVRLVTDMVDHACAIRPLLTSVKGFR